LADIEIRLDDDENEAGELEVSQQLPPTQPTASDGHTGISFYHHYCTFQRLGVTQASTVRAVYS